VYDTSQNVARTSREVRSAADIPLADVFDFALDDDVSTSLLDAQRRIESLFGDVPLTWLYSLKSHEGAPGQRRTLVEAGLAHHEDGDWRFVEYDLDFWMDRYGMVFVEVSLGVGCQCQTSHNMHYVVSCKWEAESGPALSRAIRMAADQVEIWHQTSSTSDYWLRQAGLPI
jgi:hypothetical protein